MSDSSGTDKTAKPRGGSGQTGERHGPTPKPREGDWKPPVLKPDVSQRHEVKPNDWNPPPLRPATYRTS